VTGVPLAMLALLAISGTGKALLLVVAGVAGIFTGLSLRNWRERRKK
jgi:hypothetical protein